MKYSIKRNFLHFPHQILNGRYQQKSQPLHFLVSFLIQYVITLCDTYHKIAWSIKSKHMSHNSISNNVLSSYITPFKRVIVTYMNTSRKNLVKTSPRSSRKNAKSDHHSKGHRVWTETIWGVFSSFKRIQCIHLNIRMQRLQSHRTWKQ